MNDALTAQADAVCQQGFALHQQGRLNDAGVLYQQVLRMQPRHFDALHLLGLVALQTNQPARAADLIAKAILVNSRIPAAHINYGSALSRLNRYQAAVSSYDKAIALKSDAADAHFNRGNALRELSRYEEAIASYDRAIALKPDFADGHYNRACTLSALKQHQAALASYDRVIAIQPDRSQAHNNRAVELTALKQYEAALASLAQAIASSVNNAEAYCNRGNVFLKLQRYDNAIASYDKAIAMNPDYADAHNNRGNAFRGLDRYEAAIADYEKAIAIDPAHCDAHCNLGDALLESKQFPAALACYQKAIALDPNGKNLYGTRLYAKLKLCDWRDLKKEVARLTQRIQSNHAASNPCTVLALSNSAGLQKRAAEIWVREQCVGNTPLAAFDKRERHSKIRLGYFSADFREHPVSALTKELFEIHDRSRFEVTAFSLGRDTKDETRQLLARIFDRFIDVRHNSDQDIALLARSMEIDIAIDLGGFTQGNRPEIFALRAAPLQVSYLGYSGTMGADFIDYLIGDRTVIPAASQRHYCEKIIYLPDTYLVNDSRREIADRVFSREELGLPPEGFVFCCFNNGYKITPETFDRWMRILKRVERSVLWLSEGEPIAKSNLTSEAVKRGVSAERLIFAHRMPSPAEHLARHRAADLFLDTLPYNAHATASDALWAGLPVLTCPGEAFAGRVAASLLNAVRLPELITLTGREYEDLAVELGTNSPRLSQIKHKLAANRLTTPLYDTRLFARNLEAAYAEIYERYQAGLPIEHVYMES